MQMTQGAHFVDRTASTDRSRRAMRSGRLQHQVPVRLQ